jgi:hypothetical protein
LFILHSIIRAFSNCGLAKIYTIFFSLLKKIERNNKKNLGYEYGKRGGGTSGNFFAGYARLVLLR